MTDLNVWSMPLARSCACKSEDAQACLQLTVRRPLEPDEACECSCHEPNDDAPFRPRDEDTEEDDGDH